MLTIIAAASKLKLFTLFLAFVLNGEIKTEQKTFPTADECAAAGRARAAELEQNPSVDGILAGLCVQLPGTRS